MDFQLGDQVTYHGSITEAHGPATYLGRCVCDRCMHKIWLGYYTNRFFIRTDDGDDLHHVRLASISPL